MERRNERRQICPYDGRALEGMSSVSSVKLMKGASASKHAFVLPCIIVLHPSFAPLVVKDYSGKVKSMAKVLCAGGTLPTMTVSSSS